MGKMLGKVKTMAGVASALVSMNTETPAADLPNKYANAQHKVEYAERARKQQNEAQAKAEPKTKD